MSDEPTIATRTEELSPAVAQLRTLVAGLSAIVFIISVCFSIFVWKITRNTGAVADARRQQILQLQSNVNRLGAVATDLSTYSAGRPELLAIFRNHGIDLKSPPAKPPAR